MKNSVINSNFLTCLVLSITCFCITSYAVTIDDLDKRTVVSATEYGAIPDDGQDDSTAINNALAANQRVYLPPGTYNLSNSLVLPAGGVLRGASSESVILHFNGSVSDYAIKNYSTEDTSQAQARDCIISDLTINVQSSSCLGGISILNASNIEIKRIAINTYYASVSKTSIDYGIRIRGTLTFRVEDVKLRGASCGVSLEATSMSQCNGGRLVNVYVTPATMGFNLTGCTSVSLYNCLAERIRSSFAWGVVPFNAYPGTCYYIRYCNTVTMENCYAEGFDDLFQIRDNYMVAINGMHVCTHDVYCETYSGRLGSVSGPLELANISVIGETADTSSGMGQLSVRETNQASPHDIRLRGIKGKVYLSVQNTLVDNQVSISSCEFTDIINSSDIRINFKNSTVAPSSSDDDGINGQWAYDDDYFYRCIANNTWRRISQATW